VLVQIWETQDDLEQAVTAKICDVISHSLKQKDRCFIVLSGGETPRAVYHRLGNNQDFASIDWNRVHIFFSDERAVPPGHQQSNYGMLEREWFSHASIPSQNIHRVHGELDPAAAASLYEEEIKKVFGKNPIAFDLVLLGVGADGHTASLFPGMESVLEKKALILPVFAHQLKVWRITMTVSLLNVGSEVVFFASGRKKASIIHRVLKVKNPDIQLPASLIQPRKGSICWMIDKEAALELKEDSSIHIQKRGGPPDKNSLRNQR